MMNTNKKAGPARPARTTRNTSSHHDNAATPGLTLRRIGQPTFTPPADESRRILQESTACGECGQPFGANHRPHSVAWFAHYGPASKLLSGYPVCNACASKPLVRLPHQSRLAARTLLLKAAGGTQ